MNDVYPSLPAIDWTRRIPGEANNGTFISYASYQKKYIIDAPKIKTLTDINIILNYMDQIEVKYLQSRWNNIEIQWRQKWPPFAVFMISIESDEVHHIQRHPASETI